MLTLTTSLAALAAPAVAAPLADADWTIKKLSFSAVSIGVYFKDASNGWSSFTDGSSGISLTKTTDGGSTWNTVNNQTSDLMIMGVDGTASPLSVATTGMLGTEVSNDGNNFVRSRGAPFISQSIRAYDDGRVVLATDSGVYVSSDAGKSYTAKAIPASILKTPARYAAAPSAKVIYVTAGEWPSQSNKTEAELTLKLSSEASLRKRTFANGKSQLRLELGNPSPRADPSGYKAQILKSVDGGASWVSQLFDAGNFYFNGIDCIDEDHCVAVAEGFGQDGSAAPGARVYVTSDGGSTWGLTHHDTTDGSSLMAVRMRSATSHVAGGRLATGISLHSADGGKTYTAKGASIKGQMITDFSFITDTHAFATSVNQLQICSLLEYGTA